MAADFPLLYAGAVGVESTAVTLAALAIIGIATAVAAAVY